MTLRDTIKNYYNTRIKRILLSRGKLSLYTDIKWENIKLFTFEFLIKLQLAKYSCIKNKRQDKIIL